MLFRSVVPDAATIDPPTAIVSVAVITVTELSPSVPSLLSQAAPTAEPAPAEADLWCAVVVTECDALCVVAGSLPAAQAARKVTLEKERVGRSP